MLRSYLRSACLLGSLLLTLSSAGSLLAETYHVSPNGDDQQSGARDQPWKSLAKVSEAAQAGDIVIFQAGTYPGNLAPKHSGRAGEPIVFRAENRRTARLVGSKQLRHAIHVDGKSYLRFEGFHIEPAAPRFGRWVSVTNSDHIELSDMLMQNAAGTGDLGKTPLVIQGSDQVQLRHCRLQNFLGGDMAHVFNSQHILLEGNAIGHAGHSPLALSPRIELFKGLSDVVLRGNVFFAGWGRPFEIFSERNVLFEENLIIDAYNGARSAGPEAKMMTENGIVRFNRVYRNWGAPVNLGYYHPKADAHRSRYYHNVIDDNPERAIRIETVRDHVFKNNIFSRNDTTGGGRQVVFRGDSDTFQMHTNAFWAGDLPVRMENLKNGEGYSLSQVQEDVWSQRRGPQFQGNLEVDPRFVDSRNYNHALSAESPLIDAGDFLTRAATSGSGRTVKVADAAYFYDGFGIEGEQGDTIAIGNRENQARVVNVDLAANTIHLDRDVSWDANAPVSLVWGGSQPDIGVYEQGADGRGSVQIVVDKFQCHPGEEVQLKVVTHGQVRPAQYAWQLGDGTTSSHQELAKTYPREAGYPIRVTVTGEDGEKYLACAFVDVVDPRRLEKPLLVTTFDNDPNTTPDFHTEDGNWYFIYYKSRPTVEYAIELEPNGNGFVRYWAGSDDHPLAVTAYPAGWEIDQYPILQFRYRIDKNLPLTLSVDGFSTLDDPRSMVLADVAGSAPYTLIADGNWHRLTLDVRALRENHPGVTLLRRFRFEVFQRDQVKAGDGYALDQLEILPENSHSTP